jgi:hypothetical protein
MDDRVTAWPDGTAMTVVGEDRQAEGRTWKNVRDPAGNTGWIPLEYLVRPLATLAPPPSAAALQPARDDLSALTEKVNGAMGTRFFEAVELRQGGAQLAVTVSDAWYELATHWKERTLEMLADSYATIAANRGLRGSAPGPADYPRTTFYDTFGKELGYKSADEVRVFR